jgi:hypothetical protein
MVWGLMKAAVLAHPHDHWCTGRRLLLCLNCCRAGVVWLLLVQG